MRILIADDAPFIQEMLKSILEKEGHVVVGIAGDGQEAIQLAAHYKPDLILMDLVMPKISGLEAAVQILEAQPLMKIIAISTADQEEMIYQALERGCRGFLPKPFRKIELIKIIDKEQEVRKNG
jgi:two-component system chemotaxis response regulator CheY